MVNARFTVFFRSELNKGNETGDIALENDPLFDCENEDAMMGDECVFVTETCDDENTSIIVEPESFPDVEIKFDETYIPHDEWINLMMMNYCLMRRKAYPHIQVKCRTSLQQQN